jgi:hypothetical protein
MKYLAATVICVCVATAAMAAEIPGSNGVPDLTKGGELTRINKRWVGPLGVYCGAWRPSHRVKGQLEHVRQLLVLGVDEGSPADGILEVGDVILGADGTGAGEVPLFESAPWAMIPIAQAITEAEARYPAILKLLRWRNGKTETVTIKLETLGRYADTAPYDCEKSTRILRRGIKALYEANKPDKAGFAILCLLAADDPTNPENQKYQARARQWAHELKYIAGPWFSGPQLIVLAEYYMKTKDEAIFPKLVKAAEHHAEGVSWFGTTGHKWADKRPDGLPGGRLSGYGPINCSGALGFLGLSLARKAGVDSPVVEAAIERQRIFFGHYAFHGGIGYGEMPYGIAGGRGDANGKHAMSGLALGLQKGQEEKAKYFSQMTALATYSVRQYAHGGSYFGQVWHPIGAAQGGVKAANLQFKEIRWHLDLKRRWDHTRIYDSSGNNYGDFSYGATALLFYAMPLKQLYITGRGQSESLQLTDSEFEELLAIKSFEAAGATNKELIVELSRHQGMTRKATADELANRIKKAPESEESAALVDQLLALAADGKASPSGRAGACTTLMFLKDRASGAVAELKNNQIAKTMVALLKDPDPYIRFGGVRALQKLDPTAVRPHINAILDAVVATGRPTFPLDEDDPLQWAHGEMGQLLFQRVLRGSLDGVDRSKLIPALRSLLETPNGGARGAMSEVLTKLNRDDTLALADLLVDNIRIPPPGNAMGGNRAVANSQEVLAKYSFEEALPLSFVYGGGTAVKNKIHHKYGQAAFEMDSTPDLLAAFGDLMLAGAEFDANQVIEEMSKTPAPETIARLKRITAVQASRSELTLPADKIELVVDATNYGRRGENATTYTWRKVYGAGKVIFTPNASGNSKTTTVSFTDKRPGKYRFEVTMSDTLGYNEVRDTVDIVLCDKDGKLPLNNPPRALSQSLEAVPGLPTQVTLTGTDPDGDELGFIVIKQPQHGRLTGVGSTLTYVAHYGNPQRRESTEQVEENAPPTIPSLDDLDASDPSAASAITPTKEATARKIPAASSWTDSMTFKVIDGQGKTATGSVEFKVSDQHVGVAVYEGFDYPSGGLHNKKGASSFGFSGPWINSRGSTEGYRVEGRTIGKKAESLSYAAIPSTGGRFVKGQNHTSCSRELDRPLLEKSGMLKPGGEMWFSFFFSGMMNRTVTFSAGEETSFGVFIREGSARSGVYAIINGESDEDANRNVWSRSASLRFPEGPNMVVVRCVWGKTDEDPDTVEVYRVFNAPGYNVVFPKKPVSAAKGAIPQALIKAIVINQGGFEAPLDELRVGPTRHSVMLGTRPLDEDPEENSSTN